MQRRLAFQGPLQLIKTLSTVENQRRIVVRELLARLNAMALEDELLELFESLLLLSDLLLA